MAANNKEPTSAGAPVRSPCIGVCVLDGSDTCEGCFRSASEIAGWSGFSREQQLEVIARSWQRARRSGKVL